MAPAKTTATIVASDFQEAKNVNTSGDNIMPNTNFAAARIRAVNAPTIQWLYPERRECAAARTQLVAVGGSTKAIRSVRFLDGRRTIATVRRSTAGLYGTTWRTAGATKGRHVLRAVIRDAAGRTATAERVVRICR